MPIKFARRRRRRKEERERKKSFLLLFVFSFFVVVVVGKTNASVNGKWSHMRDAWEAKSRQLNAF